MIELLCLLVGLYCQPADTPPITHAPTAHHASTERMIHRGVVNNGNPDPATAFDPTCEVQPPRDLQPYFVAAARRYSMGATQCELAKQVETESGFDIKAFNKASGAMGAAQFLKKTAAELGIDPWDPKDAIMGMAKYVRWCRERWTPGLGGRVKKDIDALGLGCYNNGLGNMRSNQVTNGWVLYADAKPYLPSETQGYVTKIMGADEPTTSMREVRD